MCVCPPSYQDRHHAVLLTRCLPASPPSPCRPTAMPSCDTHALSMVRAHVCAFSCLSVPVRFRPMCVSSVLFLVDFFVHASPHQLWRHCRNFLEQQTGFLSQRTAFVCVVSVFIAVGFKNLLNPAKVKYHHLQTPPSYLFFILTRAAPPPLLSSPCVPSRCPRLFLLPRFWQAPCFCSVILPSHVGSASLQQPWFCCLLWCALPTEHEYEKLPPVSSLVNTCASSSHFLPSPSWSALGVNARSRLVLAILFTFSLLFPPVSPSFFFFFFFFSLSLNVSPTLNSTHSGWAALCEWVAAYTAWNWKRHASFDKYRQFCMETGRVLTLRFLLPQHFLTCSAAVLLCWHRFHENKGKLILF